MSMRFDIITIFPKVAEAYFNESILKRAREKKLIDVRVWNLRDFASNRHRKSLSATMRSFGRVDDKAYGGGPGMVIKIEPLARALGSISKLKTKNYKRKTPVVLLSSSGKQFNFKMAADFTKKYSHIIFICGHYEGVDERIKKVARASGFRFQELSVGPYVLTGGELPAMAIVDAVSRHVPGVLGKGESLEERRYGIGVPAYTRPEIFTFHGKKYSVPKILVSGHHRNIEKWRLKHKRMLK